MEFAVDEIVVLGVQGPGGGRIVQPGPAEVAPPIAPRAASGGRSAVPAADVVVAGRHVAGHLQFLQQPLCPAIPVLSGKAFQFAFVEQIAGEQHEFRVDDIDVLDHAAEIVDRGGIRVVAGVGVVDAAGQMQIRDVDEVVVALAAGDHLHGVAHDVIDPAGGCHTQVVQFIHRQLGQRRLQFPAIRRAEILAGSDIKCDALAAVFELGLPIGRGRRRQASNDQSFAGNVNGRDVGQGGHDHRERVTRSVIGALRGQRIEHRQQQAERQP